jgi:hypothetical protein
MTKATAYVLKLLREHDAIRYNENFYADGKDELEQRLRKEFDIDPDDDYTPACVVDDVIFELGRRPC